MVDMILESDKGQIIHLFDLSTHFVHPSINTKILHFNVGKYFPKTAVTPSVFRHSNVSW